MSQIRFANASLLAVVSMIVSGCMNPYYGGYPYRQPMYAPPQMLNQTPGTLVIPESNNSYEPGRGTYDDNPEDDFRREDGSDSRFFDSSDNVPLPSDRNSNTFEEDLGTSLFPDRTPLAEDGVRAASYEVPAEQNAGPSSRVMMPTEYGFDTANFEWLRGTLHYTPDFNTWFVQYSLEAKDQYRGNLRLQASSAQLEGLREGDSVDVQGTVVKDPRGGAVYRVDMIRPMVPR